MTIAVLFNQLGPYHYARLTAFGKIARVFGIEFFSKSQTYKWNTSGVSQDISFIKETLFTIDNPVSLSKATFVSKLFSTLDKISPDVVVINGWSETGAFAALKWCLLNKKHAVAMSESTEFDTGRSILKELLKKRLVSKFSAAIVGGTPHRRYMNKLGIPNDRIFEKYDVIDNNYFLSRTTQLRGQGVNEKSNLNLPKNYFLASARFVQKKNLQRLIEAFAAYVSNARGEVWDLVLLGDGELQSELLNLVDKLGIKNKVIMPGFIQYDQLPEYYGFAKVFIHPSTSEQWGLVVNEAMASRLPILISNKCGCAEDLVQSNVNGLVFDPFSVKDISEKMLAISSGQYNLPKMGEMSLKIISEYSPQSFAQNLLSASLTACNREVASINIFDKLFLNYLTRR